MVGLFTSYGRVLLFSVVLNRMLCKTRHHISVLTYSRLMDVFCCFRFSVIHKLYITHTLRLGGACDKSRTSRRVCVKIRDFAKSF